MSGTLFLLAIGLLLIGLLALLLRRTESTEDDPFPPACRGSSLASPHFEERRRNLLDRIFGREDCDFVLSQVSKEVQRLFLMERKEIALCWLSEIRSQAKSAMRFHVIDASKSGKLLPMLELRLAVDYFAILVQCRFISVILLWRGPVALRGMVGHASHLSDQLRGLLEVVLKAEAFAEKTRVSD